MAKKPKDTYRINGEEYTRDQVVPCGYCKGTGVRPSRQEYIRRWQRRNAAKKPKQDRRHHMEELK